MKSPVIEAREKLGISLKELSILTGTTEQTIRCNERGTNLNITGKLLSFFESQGISKEQLVNDYEKFRNWNKDQTLKAFKIKREA